MKKFKVPVRRISQSLKTLLWKDWQDTLIFWVWAPAIVIGLYMLTSYLE